MKYLTTFVLTLYTSISLASPVPDFPFIILSDSVERQVEPDTVIVSFDIEAFGKTSAEVSQEIQQSRSEVLKIIEDHGLPSDALTSSQVRKSAKRARKDGVWNLEVLGYDANQNFRVELSNLKKFPKLSAALINVENLTEIESAFRTSKQEAYEAEMIKSLSNKVREKAEKLAKAQNRRVTKAHGITTESSFGNAYSVFSLERSPGYGIVEDVSAYAPNLILTVPKYIKVTQWLTIMYEME